MSEVVTKNDLAKILSRLPFLKIPLTNLVNGNADGSIRGVGTFPESSSYAIGQYAFVEGYNTQASGANAHAEGEYSEATGTATHAEGYDTKASGRFSHSQNMGTIASKDSQTAIGRYNEEDNESGLAQKAFIIGNGTSDTNRSNGFTVDWNGEVEIALDTSATSGVDKEIYDALVALGWDSDVIG